MDISLSTYNAHFTCMQTLKKSVLGKELCMLSLEHNLCLLVDETPNSNTEASLDLHSYLAVTYQKLLQTD